MSIEVKVDTPTKDINRKLKDVKNGTPIVMVRALNRAGAGGKTVAKRRIKSVYSIEDKVKDIEDRYMKVKRGNYNDMTYIITGRSPNINAIKFESTENTSESIRGGKGVKLRILKSNKRKELVGDAKHSKAFIKVMKNGHRGIFQRKLSEGTGKEKIKEVTSPSIAAMMKNEEVYPYVEEKQKKVFEDRIDHEINYLLNQQSKRSKK